MKTRLLSLAAISVFCASAALLGSCVPSPTEQTTPFLTVSNPGAEYRSNVSTLYLLTDSADQKTMLFKWKDSLGIIRSLSDYRGRVVLVNLGLTSDTNAQSQYKPLDSLATLHSDSVRVISIASDATAHSFVTVYNYVMLAGLHLQFVVDSTKTSAIRFVQMNDGLLGYPQTFAFDGNGTLKAVRKGTQSLDSLLDLMRLGYK